MKKVALFTTFFEVTSGYSLIAVSETQIKMLLEHGYDPVVLVQDNFTVPDSGLWKPEIIDLRACLPSFALTSKVAGNFEDRVGAILEVLKDDLEDVDVCITHDIIFQDWYKEYNVALRKYAKQRPDLLWLHWIHSCPSPDGSVEYPFNVLRSPPPGYIIYPNETDKSIVCQAYQLSGREWKVKTCRAGHSIDPLSIWPYQDLTKSLAVGADLLGGEVAVVYPARLDRGKQPEKIIRLLAGIQSRGIEARLLVIDWQSTGSHFQVYIDELLSLADNLGIKVSFTSRLDDRCSQGVSRQVVMELMDLSNVYIHPSRVETYSLVVHEALLRGNLLVLNHDFPVMRELFGDTAIYMDFGSDRVGREYLPDEQSFWNDEAGRLLAELSQNRLLKGQARARRQWTPAAMWVEFETLFYLQPVGE